MMGKKIIIFACENSGLQALEQAGGVPEAAELVKLPCTGKVEIGLTLKCLENGCDSILVLGCPEDNCKYIRGSARAGKRMEMVRKRLAEIGLDANKVRMEFVSSVDGHKVKKALEEMTGRTGRKKARKTPKGKTAKT